MNKLASAALLALLFSTSLHAQSSSGACNLSGTMRMALGDQLLWRVDPEQDREEVFFGHRHLEENARFLGVRQVGDRMHVNLEISDDELGLMEIVVVIFDDQTASRVGEAMYSIVDGEKLLDAVLAFEHADCFFSIE